MTTFNVPGLKAQINKQPIESDKIMELFPCKCAMYRIRSNKILESQHEWYMTSLQEAVHPNMIRAIISKDPLLRMFLG